MHIAAVVARTHTKSTARAVASPATPNLHTHGVWVCVDVMWLVRGVCAVAEARLAHEWLAHEWLAREWQTAGTWVTP